MDAIILAGGRGSRLHPWTAPKCLMPINGVTMLQRLLALLCNHVGKVVVCTGYRSHDVVSSVAAHSWSADKVLFSHEPPDEPMGKRLLAARNLIDPGRVLICYGDELADVDITRLIAEHEGRRAPLSFVTALQRAPGGSVEFNEWGRPRIVEDAEHLVNIGFVVVNASCWAALQPNDGLSGWVNRVAQDHYVHVFKHSGRRATVNALADLQHAEEVWR